MGRKYCSPRAGKELGPLLPFAELSSPAPEVASPIPLPSVVEATKPAPTLKIGNQEVFAFAGKHQPGSWENLLKTWPNDSGPGISLPKRIAELKQHFGLTVLNESAVKYHWGQVRFMTEFLSNSESYILHSPTGSGKTIMTLVIAAYYLARGEPVLFLTPEEHLVHQVACDAKEVLSLPPEAIALISGESRDARHKGLYADLRKLLFIATPESIRNDIEAKPQLLNLDRFKLVVFDEVHRLRGEYVYSNLVDACHDIGVRRIGLSASPAETADKVRALMKRFGASRSHSVAFKERPHWQRWIEVSLEGEHAEAAELLRAGAAGIHYNLRSLLSRQDYIWNELDAPSEEYKKRYKLASIEELQRLGNSLAVLRRDKSLPDGAAKNLAHLMQIRHAHDVLTLCGIEPFLIYTAIRIGATRSLFLDPKPRVIPGEPASRRRADRHKPTEFTTSMFREHDGLRQAYYLLARGTPFEHVLWAKSRRQLLEAVCPKKADEFLSGSETQEVFLRAASEFLVRHNFSNHPKEQKIFELLTERASANDPGLAIVMTRLADQAAFLTKRLNFRLGEVAGIPKFKSVCAAGQKHMPRPELRRNLKAFSEGEAGVLVATSVIEEGTHIPRAKFAIIGAPTSEGPRVAQRKGRVGRGDTLKSGQLFDEHTAEVVTLVTKDTREPIVALIGSKRHNRMREELRWLQEDQNGANS